MAILKKKISQRRKQVRESMTAERTAKINELASSGVLVSILILIGFVCVCSLMFSIFAGPDRLGWHSLPKIISYIVLVILIALAMSVYINHYNQRVIKKHPRALALAGLFITLLLVVKLGSFFAANEFIAIGTAITAAMILTIAYDQRFALGMSMFYAVFAYFDVGGIDFSLFLTMIAGVLVCCFSLREIRTRIKLLEVSAFAAAIVFITSIASGLIVRPFSIDIIKYAFITAATVIAVGIIIQALLPIIERVFRIATSMTLLDYSDANQPLLKKLAMEAPGTFSHSLLIGSLGESAAEAIGANGLLCRVGAYYHDIGKIGKPRYFIENQMGDTSKHEQLSPAMSQLVIVGHVKDGIEMAKEYRLPAIIRQFIETHHGTTLIQYFYEEAKKQSANGKGNQPSEAEFRYPGPKPQTIEAAILMLSDAVEGAVRSVTDVTPTKIETAVHNMAMRRLQDGQFDECELTLKQLSIIETSLSKSLAAHYHGRIAYPKPVDKPDEEAESNGQ